MLFKPKTDADNLLSPLGIDLVECDICGSRFSISMKWAWPFCNAGIPHRKMESKTQLEYRNKLMTYEEEKDYRYIDKLLEGYGKRSLNCSWKDENLPDCPPVIDVRIPREKYQRFRDMYISQGIFIGNLLNKRNWSMDDLIEHEIDSYNKQFIKSTNQEVVKEVR